MTDELAREKIKSCFRLLMKIIIFLIKRKVVSYCLLVFGPIVGERMPSVCTRLHQKKQQLEFLCFNLLGTWQIDR